MNGTSVSGARTTSAPYTLQRKIYLINNQGLKPIKARYGGLSRVRMNQCDTPFFFADFNSTLSPSIALLITHIHAPLHFFQKN